MNTTDLKQIREVIREATRHLAAKKDLQGFTAKKDLREFATKEDLERFATKEDLKKELDKYATKEDLKRELSLYATKKDLREGLGTLLVGIVEVLDKHKADKTQVDALEERVTKLEEESYV